MTKNTLNHANRFILQFGVYTALNLHIKTIQVNVNNNANIIVIIGSYFPFLHLFRITYVKRKKLSRRKEAKRREHETNTCFEIWNLLWKTKLRKFTRIFYLFTRRHNLEQNFHDVCEYNTVYYHMAKAARCRTDIISQHLSTNYHVNEYQ